MCPPREAERVLVLEPKCQHAFQREKGVYLPFYSGEVLSGYLSYADYPKQKISLGCPTSVARGHVQGLPLVLRCAVWVGVTPKTHSIGYQKLSKLRVH